LSVLGPRDPLKLRVTLTERAFCWENMVTEFDAEEKDLLQEK
jgi:hypothetical protein